MGFLRVLERVDVSKPMMCYVSAPARLDAHAVCPDRRNACSTAIGRSRKRAIHGPASKRLHTGTGSPRRRSGQIHEAREA